LPLLTAVSLAARLPFLSPGFGTDPDAWRVGLAAQFMRSHGTFRSSRVPGHPVQDLAAWALSGFGSLGVNLATALLSVAAVALFHRLCRRFGIPHAFLLSLGFAFMPIVFVHSVDAMDYLWALPFALGAIELLLSGKPLPAGACLGLATGCRITSIVLLAALVPLCDPQRRSRDLIRCAGAALATSVLCYVPVVLAHGLDYLRFTPTQYPRLLYVAKAFTIDLFGVLGLAGVAAALTGMRRDETVPAAWKRVRWATAVMLAVSIPLFLRLPDDAAYLLPAVPFVLWTIATVVRRDRVVVLAVALALSGFLLRLRDIHPMVAPWPTGPGLRLSSRVSLDLKGPILVDHARRVADEAYAGAVLDRLPGNATLLAAEWWPMLTYKGGGPAIVQYPTAAELDSLAKRPLYFIPDAEREILIKTGLDVRRWGARPWPAP